MNTRFAEYFSVTSCDAVLRNAVLLDCSELVEDAIARGANISCQYMNDWNTPLHWAIVNRCGSKVIDTLMRHKPDYRLVNADGLTAAELALERGEVEITRKFIEAEFEGVDPVEAFYECLKRNSVKVLEILIEILKLSGDHLAQCLVEAWCKLEVMNVQLNSELELFAHVTLVRLDYEKSLNNGNAESQTMSQREFSDRMQLLMKNIQLVEKKFDTGLCHDVNDEFLEVLRIILRHLFMVKNRVDYFPALQLEYCIAMYLAIFDRRQELDLFQLVVDKCSVIKYLKLFRRSYEKVVKYDTRMSPELLFRFVKTIQSDSKRKCKQTLNDLSAFVSKSYKLKEQVMIRNHTLKSRLMKDILSLSFAEITKSELSLLKTESDALNRMFDQRKSRYQHKELYKTYFKLKQMYSLQKSIRYLQVIENLPFNTHKNGCYIEMLAVQRILQVLGETLKSTKLSPNISTKLRSTLEFIAPGDLLKRITKLRQYFSHEYSATKHTIYQRLRANDTDLIEFFKRIQSDLLKLIPLLSNVYTLHTHKFFRTFLGRVLHKSSVGEVHSYAKTCRVQMGFKIDFSFKSSDVLKVMDLLIKLEKTYDPDLHKENLALVEKIKRMFKNYVELLDYNAVDFMTEYVMCGVGEMCINDTLENQKNTARFFLTEFNTPKYHEYGATTFIMHVSSRTVRNLMTVESRTSDDRSESRIHIIQDILQLAAAKELGQFQELTLGKEASFLDMTRQVSSQLLEESLPDDLLDELDKDLKKAYQNLFAIDEKYRAMKSFAKRHNLKYNNQTANRLRKEDAHDRQNVLNSLIQDISTILSLPNEMPASELISLVVAYGKYQTNSADMFALEIILLEVLEILSSQGILLDNRSALSTFRPVISGRNMRNYLAHDGLVYEVVCRNKSFYSTILLNAIYLCKYGKIDLYKNKSTAKAELSFDILKVDESLRQLIDCKLELFESIKAINFDSFPVRAELKARQLYNNRTVLMAIIGKHSEQTIQYLLDRPTQLKMPMETLFRECPNQQHSFFDEDDFTMLELVGQSSLQANMAFYLALKYHHFDLEQELDVLYEGAYTEDSLHLAIRFLNEQSACSIIEHPRLYDICKNNEVRYKNSILHHAILHKLPTVVRRICETSPELIEEMSTGNDTPLRLAISTGCMETVAILLQFGAQVFNPYKPPIIYAIQVRKYDILEMLLPSNGELVMNKPMLDQVVVNAAISNHRGLLRKLLPLMSSPEVLKKSLHEATKKKHLQVVDLLLEHDSTIVNEKCTAERTPLVRACISGSRKIVQLLLRKGADCCLPAEYPALYHAIDEDQHELFKLLLQAGVRKAELRENLFAKFLTRRMVRWCWTVYQAGLPCTVIDDKTSQIRGIIDDRVLGFLLKMCHYKRDFVNEIDCYIIANAVLLKNMKFVQCVFPQTYQRMIPKEIGQLLNCAVKNNDKDMLGFFIASGCNVNVEDGDRITPLALAAAIGKPEMVKMLIKAGADPNQCSRSQCNEVLQSWILTGDNYCENLGVEYHKTYPLILAALYSHSKVVEYLYQMGAKIDPCDQNGLTPLLVAMAQGHVEVVQILIQLKADVDYARKFTFSMTRNASVMHYVAHNGHLEVFKLLADEHNFDPTQQDDQGNTPLHEAIREKHAAVVSYFTNSEHWTIVNNAGKTPLQLAFENFNQDILECVRRLPVRAEAIRSYRDTRQRTLLQIAISNKDFHLSKTLGTEFGVDCTSVDRFGNTAIRYAVQMKDFKTVSLLMDCGASLSDSVGDGQAPSYILATMSNQIDVVKLFLQKDVEAPKKLLEFTLSGYNLLHVCVTSDFYDMCELLLNNVGFDVNSSHDNGNIALHLAAASSSIRMVSLLLENGSVLDKTNMDEKTPLIVAIEKGNWKVAHYLLVKGASRDIVSEYKYENCQEMNLLHRVATLGELNSLKFLLDHKFFARSVKDSVGRTIGHYASFHKQHHVVEYLIATGFPLDLLDDEGRSSLVHALMSGDVELAKRMQAIGCSLDIVKKCHEQDSLLEGIPSKQIKNVFEFLTKECKLSLEPLSVETVPPEPSIILENPDLRLINHLLNGERSEAQALIESGVSWETVKHYRVQSRDQETVLHVVARNGFTLVLELLLENAVFEVDIGDTDLTTPLQEAAMHGRKDCVQLLLQHGANPDFVDLQNTTALTRAFTGFQEEVAVLLLDHGVQLQNSKTFRVVCRYEESLLHFVLPENLGLVKLLVERVGIDINVVDKFGRTPLHYAAVVNSVQAIEYLLESGARTNVADNDQQTPLITAIMSGHHDAAKRFLTETLDREYLRKFRLQTSQRSILHIAYEKQLYRILEQLIVDFEQDCSVPDSEGKTILHYAVLSGNKLVLQQIPFKLDLFFNADHSGKTPIGMSLQQSTNEVFEVILRTALDLATPDELMLLLEIVLKEGSNSHIQLYSAWLLDNRRSFITGKHQIIELLQKYYDRCPLDKSALSNAFEVAQLLLECSKDNPSVLEDDFLTDSGSWLLIAAFKNFHQLAKILLEDLKVPADFINEHGRTALDIAVLSKHMEVAAVLLEAGANVNHRDPLGRVPLLSALENNDSQMVKLLLAHGASIPLVDEFRYNNSNNKFKILNLLAERGFSEMISLVLPSVDVNCLDSYRMTPLHYAAVCNQLEVIDLLISAGATLDAKDQDGTTPLMRALAKNHIQAYRKLAGYGANVDLAREFKNLNYDDETILHITAEKGRLEATKLLVEELNVDVDCLDKDGNTPLHNAAKNGCFEVIKYLLRRNAIIYHENKAGETALQLIGHIEKDFFTSEGTSNN